MILGQNRAKLSKRNGIGFIAQYREQGFSPIGGVNYLALLEWSSGDNREIMDMGKLVYAFTMKRVSKPAKAIKSI